MSAQFETKFQEIWYLESTDCLAFKIQKALRHKVDTCCSLENVGSCLHFSTESHYQNDVVMYKAMIAVVPT